MTLTKTQALGQNAAGPKILLTDTNRWPLGPRLAMRLADLGGYVAVVCPSPRHPAAKTKAVRRTFRYSASQPLVSLKHAIEAVDPDFILPLCDRSVEQLHELYRESEPGGTGAKIRHLIEHSLGEPDNFTIVSSRYQLLQVAQSEGILVPEMAPIASQGELDLWCARLEPPWVIKAEGSCGGRGVRIAEVSGEAEHSWLDLRKRPTSVELVKRLSLNRGRRWILAEWSRTEPKILAQAYIRGRPGNCAVSCWRGKLLGGIAVEVLQSKGPTEPAKMVRVVDGREMLWAAERLARRLHLSGFFGLDFMIEEGTGRPFLIEMNPRCTPPCPIPLGPGRDLVTALWSQIIGQPVKERSAVTDKSHIAYFPQSTGSSNGKPQALSADTYYDVPVGEPALIEELLHPWQSRSLLGQALDFARTLTASKRGTPECVYDEAVTPLDPEARSALRR